MLQIKFQVVSYKHMPSSVLETGVVPVNSRDEAYKVADLIKDEIGRKYGWSHTGASIVLEEITPNEFIGGASSKLLKVYADCI